MRIAFKGNNDIHKGRKFAAAIVNLKCPTDTE